MLKSQKKKRGFFMFLLTLVYYLGIASCGIQGAENGYKLPYTGNILVSSFFAAFGGGLIRDIVLLNTIPVVFTSQCIPDIVIALFSGMMYINIKQKKIIKYLSIFADAASLGKFISIGIEKAIPVTDSELVIVTCGIVTALGGGVLSRIFCGYSIKLIIISNINYRFFTVFGAIIYYKFIQIGIEHITVQSIIVVYTTITAIACNNNITNMIKKHLKNCFCQRYILTDSINIQKQINTKQIFAVQTTIHKYRYLYRLNENSNLIVHINYMCTCKIIMLHRIRQM